MVDLALCRAGPFLYLSEKICCCRYAPIYFQPCLCFSPIQWQCTPFVLRVQASLECDTLDSVQHLTLPICLCPSFYRVASEPTGASRHGVREMSLESSCSRRAPQHAGNGTPAERPPMRSCRPLGRRIVLSFALVFMEGCTLRCDWCRLELSGLCPFALSYRCCAQPNVSGQGIALPGARVACGCPTPTSRPSKAYWPGCIALAADSLWPAIVGWVDEEITALFRLQPPSVRCATGLASLTSRRGRGSFFGSLDALRVLVLSRGRALPADWQPRCACCRTDQAARSQAVSIRCLEAQARMGLAYPVGQVLGTYAMRPCMSAGACRLGSRALRRLPGLALASPVRPPEPWTHAGAAASRIGACSGPL